MKPEDLQNGPEQDNAKVKPPYSPSEWDDSEDEDGDEEALFEDEDDEGEELSLLEDDEDEGSPVESL